MSKGELRRYLCHVEDCMESALDEDNQKYYYDLLVAVSDEL